MLPMRIMRAEGRFRSALRPMGKPTYDPRAVLVSRRRQLLRRGAIASGPRRVVPQDRRPWSGRSPRSLSITRPPPASKSHPCDAEAEPLNLSGVVRQPCTFNVAASQDRVDGTVTGVAPFGSAVSDAWSAISSAMPEPSPPSRPRQGAHHAEAPRRKLLIEWRRLWQSGRRRQIFCSFRLRNVLRLQDRKFRSD